MRERKNLKRTTPVKPKVEEDPEKGSGSEKKFVVGLRRVADDKIDAPQASEKLERRPTVMRPSAVPRISENQDL